MPFLIGQRVRRGCLLVLSSDLLRDTGDIGEPSLRGHPRDPKLYLPAPVVQVTEYLNGPLDVLVTPPATDPFSFALSPNGRRLAFVATADATSRLWVRSFDDGTARPLGGTEGASYPFWSPDGTAIGFFGDGKLKRVDAAGGVPLALTNVAGARGGTWNQDGVIVFAPQTSG